MEEICVLGITSSPEDGLSAVQRRQICTVRRRETCSTPGTITNGYEDGNCSLIANVEDCEGGQIQNGRYEKQTDTIINNPSVGRNDDYNSNDTITTNINNDTNDKNN